MALVDPETSKVDTALYDAEVASGEMRLKSEDAMRVIWTRLSGDTGPAHRRGHRQATGTSLLLSVEGQEAGGERRPFALFAAAGATAYRGVCLRR